MNLLENREMAAALMTIIDANADGDSPYVHDVATAHLDELNEQYEHLKEAARRAAGV